MKAFQRILLVAVSAMFLTTQAKAILFWGRPYDPNLQRWIQRDPLGDEGSLARIETGMNFGFVSKPFESWGGANLFSYVVNNPVNEIDPLGLFGDDPYTLPVVNGSQVNGVPALTITGSSNPCGGNSPLTISNNDSPEELALLFDLGLFNVIIAGLEGPDEEALTLGTTGDETLTAEEAVSPAVRNAMYKGGIEDVPQAEREAAANYYDQMAQTAKGDAAKALNAARANYIRNGGTPPGGIRNFR
jgi:RHS repeat-associated protein